MNAGGPFSIDAVSAVFRVQKISVAKPLDGERDPNDDADARGEQETPRKFPSRSGTEQSRPLRHGLWRHAPFVAQIIGQILPPMDARDRVMTATYGDRPHTIAAIIDTQI